MPCMCGDTYCPSCGPAQGNARCPWCGAWELDGGCQRPDFCSDCDEKERSRQSREDTQIDFFPAVDIPPTPTTGDE
jgi:hypothetical protein